MLDSVTKKRIDDLRNILVGKIPSPQSQVEQITTGLIYKFMYDMDNEAIEMGGVPSFFVEEFEKYSWKHLFNKKLEGVKRVKLYSEAIENLYNNPNAPAIFREIFKNSFLPFKEPSTLNMFLKEINEFHYSNSEQLGDAYEYLLSFMGAQGDAGQFRTPRHIIDFIIEIVNPKKNETILDPACGTSGFLISSYKHILNQNTQTRIGDKLTASERKQIGDNLIGYDIDPAMSRISLVNMYLHNFASPNISEYDTLSSESKWNEYFDVILANPPFFSPTGGIKPHSRFGVKSTRAEVLFVDYIIEHLKPNGRSGIIVPEGVIFQNGSAYKTIRKKLIEDCLVGVISLPVGVFQPYSGVKTSILLLDKDFGKKTEEIFFANVNNDGFSLNSHRSPIKENDLPNLIDEFVNWSKGYEFSGNNSVLIRKTEILSNSDFSLSLNTYAKQKDFESEFPIIDLGEVCNFEGGTQPPKSTFIQEEKDGYIRLIQTRDYKSDRFKVYIPITERHKTCNSTDVMIGRYGPPVFQILRGLSGAYNVALMKCLPNKEKLLEGWLFYLLKSDTVQDRIISLSERVRQSGVRPDDLKSQKIPLPPIEIQQKFINELDGYQKIINGCQEVVDNYKPTIEIDPSSKFVELRELVGVNNGNTLTMFDAEGDLAGIKVSDMNLYENQVNIVTSNKKVNQKRFNQKNILPVGSIIFPKRGAAIATNKKRITKIPCVIDNNCMGLTVKSKDLLPEYLFNFLCGFDLTTISKSAGIPLINNPDILSVKIPLPSIEIQSLISANIQKERELIEGSKKLSKIYTDKIQNKINQAWNKNL